MIEKFSNWLNESLTNEEFYTKFIDAAKRKGLKFEVSSSNAQKKNGTVEIHVIDPELVEKELKARDIRDEDFISPQGKAQFMQIWTQGYAEHNSRKSKYAEYTVYSRGGVRTKSASSDGFKFTPNEEGIDAAVDWIIRNVQVWCINSVTRYLVADRFIKYKKGRDLDLTALKDYMNLGAYSTFEIMREKFPEMYQEVATDLAFICFLGYFEGGILESRDNNFPTRSWSGYYENSKISARLHLELNWVVGTKNKSVVCKFAHSFGTMHPSYRSNLNVPKLLDETDLPSGLVNAHREIQKGNLDFEKLANDLRGTRAGHKFGI